jgi:hypothetical protein
MKPVRYQGGFVWLEPSGGGQSQKEDSSFALFFGRVLPEFAGEFVD